MIKNFIIVALRNFWANKSYLLMNIVGLGIAIALAILAYFHFSWNNEFNASYNAHEDVFRIDMTFLSNGNKQETGLIPYVLGKRIKAELPEVKSIVRYSSDFYNASIKVNDNVFKDGIYYADRSFFDLFSFNFLQGTPNAFKEQSSVILREDFAKKYFGDADPIGKELVVRAQDKIRTYVVRGVVASPPVNSSFRFHIIAPMEGFFAIYQPNFDENNWTNWQTAETFVKLHHADQVPIVNKLLTKFLKEFNKYNPAKRAISITLIPMKDVPGKRIPSFTEGYLSPKFILLTSMMALLVLLIASFNYTNTSIALAGKRLKEIGIRKVMGSTSYDLMKQFLLEHMVLSFVALLTGLILIFFFGQFYWTLWDAGSYNLQNANILNLAFYLTLLVLTITFLSGGYPAFYISRLRPIEVVKKNMKVKGGNSFTKGLLIVQFAITIVGLGSGILFVKNAAFIDRIDKGYDIESVISVPINGEKEFLLYKNAIQSNPKIVSIGGAAQNIGWQTFQQVVKTKDGDLPVDRLNVGSNFLETMGVKLKEGRCFSEKLITDTSKVIVNETFVKAMKMENAILSTIEMEGGKSTIIGVVEDFMQQGVNSEIPPMVITFLRGNNEYSIMAVKTFKDDLANVDKFLERKWKMLFPELPYTGYPQIQDISWVKRMNRNMGWIFLSVSAISMALCLAGLYVLISLIVNKRAKEIGVRKVLGASILSIATILGKAFFLILLSATFLGSTLGVLLIKPFIDSILKRHIDVTFLDFLVASLLIILVAGVTISLNVIRAATANPVKSLRSE